MAFSTQSFFRGELDGKNIRDFQKMDYSLDSLEERKKYVSDLLDGSNYFQQYFDNHFKVALNAGDPTSEDINICNVLENMANYLLNSEDVKEEDRRNKPVYVFHKSNEKFEKKIERETVTVNNANGCSNIVDEENVIHAMLAKKTNSRLPKVQTIKKSDLVEDSECGRILREYQQFLDHVNVKLKEKPDKLWRYYSKAKAQIQDDMVNVKDSLKGVWGYNSKISESSKPDLDVFDFTDYDTVKYMISVDEPSFDFNYEMWIVWKDFNEIVKNANLTIEENAIFYCLQNQWKIIEISEYFELDYDRIRRTIIPNIVKKICKLGKKYDAEDASDSLKIDERKKNSKKVKEVI